VLFPGVLEPRRAAEKAVVAVIQAACIQGASTFSVNDLTGRQVPLTHVVARGHPATPARG
jgi:hypothetical protein